MKYARHSVLGVVCALIVAAVTACGGNGATTPSGCNAPLVIVPPVVPVLVFPSPGATGVPSGPFDITIDNGRDTLALFLVSSSGTTINATNLRTVNPPAPDGRAATVPQLAPQTAYHVFATLNVPPNPCVPPGFGTAPSPNVLLGSFTTG